jgi:general secretion pathway protein C
MAISLDAAKRLAAWKDQPLEQWLKLANRYLPPIVIAVLVLAIAYRLAELTWLLVPSTPPDSPPPPVIASRTTSPAPSTTNYGSLATWHPFGVAPAVTEQPVVAALDAPDTTLALVLNGVQGYEEPTDGFAFISSGRGEQKLYHGGDVIEGANGATLHSVYADRVLIDRGGVIETLRFPEPQDLARAAPPTARLAPPPQQSNAGSLREVISANASRITDIIRAAPHIEGDQMIGYRVTPARNREAFAQLGLEPGDVLTEVNGTALNDPASSLQVFESLGEASTATVTVLRNGSPQVVVIDMTQVQNIAENLQ